MQMMQYLLASREKSERRIAFSRPEPGDLLCLPQNLWLQANMATPAMNVIANQEALGLILSASKEVMDI